MVAFATDHEPGTDTVEPKNRVGDFFVDVPDRAGWPSPATCTVAGKNERFSYDACRSVSLAQRDEPLVETTTLEESSVYKLRYRIRADDQLPRQPVDYIRQLKEHPPLEIEFNQRPLATTDLPLSLAVSSEVLVTDKLVWEFVPLGPDNFGMLTIYHGTGYTTDRHYQLSKDITTMLSGYGVPLGEVDTIQYYQRWRAVQFINPED